MSTINTFLICEQSNKSEEEALSAKAIASLLLAGERVQLNHVGEIFVIHQDNLPPQIEFSFENSFIATVVESEIERLQEYKDALMQ